MVEQSQPNPPQLALAPAPTPTPERRRQLVPRPVKRFLGGIGVAAVCVMPIAELGLEDITAVKGYAGARQELKAEPPVVNHVLSDLLIGAAITAESVGLGLTITKTKNLKGAYKDFEKIEEKAATKKAANENDPNAPRETVRQRLGMVALKAGFAPVKVFEKVGGGIEKIGEKMEKSRFGLARKAGPLTTDLGKVNAMGTSPAILQEHMKNETPNVGRMTRLGALFAASFVAVAEAGQSVYHLLPNASRIVPSTVYEGFQTLTNPFDTPGQVALSTTAVLMAYGAYKFNNFRLSEAQKEQAIGQGGTGQYAAIPEAVPEALPQQPA